MSFVGTSSYAQSKYYFKTTDALKREKSEAAAASNNAKVTDIDAELRNRAEQSQRVEQLQRELKRKLEVEDYLGAESIKGDIAKVKASEGKVNELRTGIESSLSSEDYEKAEKYKSLLIAEHQQIKQEDTARQNKQSANKKRAEEAKAKKLAEEKEAQRLAEEVEAKRLAEEKEAKRLADEAEAKRLAEEKEAKRLAEEAESKRLAEEAEAKRLAEEKEAKRLAAAQERQSKITQLEKELDEKLNAEDYYAADRIKTELEQLKTEDSNTGTEPAVTSLKKQQGTQDLAKLKEAEELKAKLAEEKRKAAELEAKLAEEKRKADKLEAKLAEEERIRLEKLAAEKAERERKAAAEEARRQEEKRRRELARKLEEEAKKERQARYANMPEFNEVTTGTLYSENFDGSKVDFSVSNIKDRWKGPHNGAYESRQYGFEGSGFGYTTLNINIDQEKDYSITTNVLYISGDTENPMGIIWGAKGTSLFLFGINKKGTLVISEYENGRLRKEHLSEEKFPGIKENWTNVLKVAKIGDEWVFVINDKELHRMPYTGTYGVNTGFALPYNATARFDNFKINYIAQ